MCISNYLHFGVWSRGILLLTQDKPFSCGFDPFSSISSELPDIHFPFSLLYLELLSLSLSHQKPVPKKTSSRNLELFVLLPSSLAFSSSLNMINLHLSHTLLKCYFFVSHWFFSWYYPVNLRLDVPSNLFMILNTLLVPEATCLWPRCPLILSGLFSLGGTFLVCSFFSLMLIFPASFISFLLFT